MTNASPLTCTCTDNRACSVRAARGLKLFCDRTLKASGDDKLTRGEALALAEATGGRPVFVGPSLHARSWLVFGGAK